jgi:hypothetical protein
MIGRQLIDALRQPEPEAEPPPAPVPPPLPPGLLGYGVARTSVGQTVLTHTSPMPRDEAQREMDAQRAADKHGYGWGLAEIRRAPMPP